MKDELTLADGGAWAVTGILTDLQGAVLTSSVGDGGLAGTLDLAAGLLAAVNDASFGSAHLEGELG
ncbi:hypothetical protein [Ramlibacter sp. PS4R-6]|uniref:hypothetical protein n=1 Tax=Ramlibacter sp. PS4R-6 TaxID=3133438 RepID=UPI00309C032E